MDANLRLRSHRRRRIKPGPGHFMGREGFARERNIKYGEVGAYISSRARL